MNNSSADLEQTALQEVEPESEPSSDSDSSADAVVQAESALANQDGLYGKFADRLYHWIIFVASVVVIGLSFALSCHDNGEEVLVTGVALPELCMSRRLGHECPGCGLTRSFISLAHGELWRSLTFNPAGLLLFGLVVTQIPFRTYQLWRMHRGREPFFHRWLFLPFAICIAVMFGQWIVKIVALFM